MTIELIRKKNQKFQNNKSKLEDFDLKGSINSLFEKTNENKSYLRVLGVSVSFLEFSNKNNMLDLTLELKSTPFNELDSEFKTILKQEFLKPNIKKK